MGYDTTAWTTAGNTLTIGGTTLYADFGIGASEAENFVINTHHPIPYNSLQIGNHGHQNNIIFGTSAEPATSYTTAAGSETHAGYLLPSIWYLPDNIYVDAVYSLEGADTATGDTSRMHLYSYDFTSGSTSALTNGTLLAHNTDVNNAGSEQIYLSTWTIDSPSVSSGKAILAFFRSDSISSNYSVSVKVKYHLT
tara:strand:- start:865 stop:1449 length:585 start_codon:yes stop_codon:yes gene_type:complete